VANYRNRPIRRRRRSPFPSIAVAAMVAIGVWWLYPRSDVPADGEGGRSEPRPLLTTDRPETEAAGEADPDLPERGSNDHATTPGEPASEQRVAALIAAGKRALEAGDPVTARSHFSDALASGVGEPERSMLRGELTRIGTETIFSQRVFADDPLTDRYVIQAGDTLGKIAKAHSVSDDLLADINGIKNKNLIREGQSIKIVRGPFHARVETDAHSMGIYIDNTFVRQYRVGLGLDNGTPTGVWKVGTKLKDPTYYPPRGGSRIIPPHDPENPLGGYWIGLSGVSGEALGQLRYGIHGTNEPETIGKSVSLGCIRMYNEDVKQVYSYLIEEKSRVEVVR
jgi:hypothetical protein